MGREVREGETEGSEKRDAWEKLDRVETAVTKVFDDLLVAVDREQMSAVCLLDLSSAFDTVDHDLLLQPLECQFGLCGTVFQWIQSYLSDRTFRVVYGDVLSFVVYVMCSVPQGSVLGPLFFIMYMADLADRAVKYGISSRLCGRHTAVPALPPRRNGVIRRSTRALCP